MREVCTDQCFIFHIAAANGELTGRGELRALAGARKSAPGVFPGAWYKASSSENVSLGVSLMTNYDTLGFTLTRWQLDTTAYILVKLYIDVLKYFDAYIDQRKNKIL